MRPQVHTVDVPAKTLLPGPRDAPSRVPRSPSITRTSSYDPGQVRRPEARRRTLDTMRSAFTGGEEGDVRFEGDDAGRAAPPRVRSRRRPACRPCRPRHKRVDRANLLRQLPADVGVAIERIRGCGTDRSRRSAGPGSVPQCGGGSNRTAPASPSAIARHELEVGAEGPRGRASRAEKRPTTTGESHSPSSRTPSPATSRCFRRYTRRRACRGAGAAFLGTVNHGEGHPVLVRPQWD